MESQRTRMYRGKCTMVRKWSLMLLCAAVVSLFAAHLCRSDVSPIPPGEAEAKTALEKSTRHYEWVNIPVPGRRLS